MLYDAHNHLHDARLAPHLPAILEKLGTLDLRGAVVNGTRESDWSAVAALSTAHSWAIPSFGLHPWHVPQRSPEWSQLLRRFLAEHPDAAVGEIGLDRWIEGHDLGDQTRVFVEQLTLAAAENRPVTIHCIQAWGALWEVLRSHALPERGILIHAYGGPAEMVAGFIERGAHFSFSPSFLQERKAAQREVFRQLPADRLLVETDAPDLRPPDTSNPNPLADGDGQPINHPANLKLAYEALAEIRQCPLRDLEETAAANFLRLFGWPRGSG